jgi:pyruvate dehydrogenase (quinone)
VDIGMGNVWGARYLTPNGRRRVIGSFRHGSMANALPQAIGAQLSNPGRQVVSISGDGGLAMLMGDLLTLAAYEIPVKVVLFNNATLGIKLEMLVDGLPSYGTDHPAVDFSAIATACGIHATRVKQPADVHEALAKAFVHPGPALVELIPTPRDVGPTQDHR